MTKEVETRTLIVGFGESEKPVVLMLLVEMLDSKPKIKDVAVVQKAEEGTFGISIMSMAEQLGWLEQLTEIAGMACEQGVDMTPEQVIQGEFPTVWRH